ncbi:LysR family transcriptional regulator [Pseudomonas sp. 14P_8.1_Bac3]|uniref:LysR family transcriptional regulator n=1 Tax=Pseudomonas sp. 14P_8.1_Bac3 TaxID=2971621 RepID=UPI0021C748A6|nr:LysR family transcriptional regulator [Pseudomonas sp. 14P_8.1_Bac3]MCU1758785.1 LysR family transcriptional regulator [Pseudomonas sp. 14P_8.1_Bac3]
MSSLLNQSSSLIAFVRVVETGSFSAAARNSGTTPSAISKSIARLETELQATLFRRSTRSLSLTPEGQAFFDRVAPLLRAIDDSADAVRPVGDARGHLRVSMPSELGRLLMPAIHSTFLAAHPDVDLDLTLLDHHVEVISEGYDVIFRVGSLVDSTLKARTLARMSMVLVASPSFLCAHGHPASIDDLRRTPFARYQLSGRTLPIFFENGETLLPRGRIGLDSGFGLRAAALEGMGVAYVMRCMVQQDLETGKLVELLREHPLPELALHAVHAFGNITPIRVKIFTDFIRNEVRGWL